MILFLIFTHLFIHSASLPFNKYLTFVHQVPGAILGFGSRTVNYTDNALLSRSQHFSKGEKTWYGTDIF